MQHTTNPARLLVRQRSDQIIITIVGELDITTTADLRNQILTTLNTTKTPVIIDLSEVSYCDSSGLALLVGTQRHASLHGLTLTLAAPRPNLTKILRLTGLDRTFTIQPTLTQISRTH